MRDRAIAIVGYSETKIELRSGRSVFDLAGEAMAGVLEIIVTVELEYQFPLFEPDR